MLEILLHILLMAVGLAILIKGADLLISGASGLAKRAGISDMVIGLTVVALGTSLPELTINLLASLQGASGITMGNVVGSNITNILLILGIAAIINPLKISRDFVRKEIPLNFLATGILLAMVMDPLLDGFSRPMLSRSEGLVLMITFIGYVYFLAAFLERNHSTGPGIPLKKSILFIAVGIPALIAGSRMTVNSGIHLSEIMGISQAFVGLFFIAVGTSLPELITSAVAAYRGKPDMALGNVAGSNLFNISLVLGSSALVNPIPVPSLVYRDLIFLIIATSALLLAYRTGPDRSISRGEGILLVAMYIAYMLYSWYLEVAG